MSALPLESGAWRCSDPQTSVYIVLSSASSDVRVIEQTSETRLISGRISQRTASAPSALASLALCPPRSERATGRRAPLAASGAQPARPRPSLGPRRCRWQWHVARWIRAALRMRVESRESAIAMLSTMHHGMCSAGPRHMTYLHRHPVNCDGSCVDSSQRIATARGLACRDRPRPRGRRRF